MARVTQALYQASLADVDETVRVQLEKAGLARRIKPKMKIAITAGSRGIAGLPAVLKSITSFVKARGAKPFIVPAMGSHGGATAEGQVKVLNSIGVTEKSVGAPIRSSMKTVTIGQISPTVPVHMDAFAVKADGIIVVNRVKEHTDFSAQVESGLMKMMAVGLGKHEGACALHSPGIGRMSETVVKASRLIFSKTKILCGVAVLEDAYQNVAHIEAFAPRRIEEGDRRLLRRAKRHAARLPFAEIDVLVVERIGKEISGTGMDPNVTGRYAFEARRGKQTHCRTVVVLGLTRETKGNALGLGMADITTARVVEGMDVDSTYANVLTSGSFAFARVPVVLRNDQEAITAALVSGLDKSPEEVRLVRIRDTLHLDSLFVSEGLLAEAKANPSLTVEENLRSMKFDAAGNLV
ncbi:MAG: DUF362 domain-containing protein [Armatimonadetes bacterium]|nr:DUF362 domain-containing protein [Armatimonadota bacterium]NIO74609.1 DUF362 domain-containing protein [Armatimonadota bacterium]NIO96564.1 DUF362 domain-containing protein [Armatimonadota bacterium]